MTLGYLNKNYSEIFSEFKKVAEEKGLSSSVDKAVERLQAEKELNPSFDLMQDFYKLTAGLKNAGYVKEAEELETKFFLYKNAQTHLYRVHDEDGDDILEFAHPDGDAKVENAKNNYGDVETLISQHQKTVEVAHKSPTGKNTTAAILNQAAQALGFKFAQTDPGAGAPIGSTPVSPDAKRAENQQIASNFNQMQVLKKEALSKLNLNNILFTDADIDPTSARWPIFKKYSGLDEKSIAESRSKDIAKKLQEATQKGTSVKSQEDAAKDDIYNIERMLKDSDGETGPVTLARLTEYIKDPPGTTDSGEIEKLTELANYFSPGIEKKYFVKNEKEPRCIWNLGTFNDNIDPNKATRAAADLWQIFLAKQQAATSMPVATGPGGKVTPSIGDSRVVKVNEDVKKKVLNILSDFNKIDLMMANPRMWPPVIGVDTESCLYALGVCNIVNQYCKAYLGGKPKYLELKEIMEDLSPNFGSTYLSDFEKNISGIMNLSYQSANDIAGASPAGLSPIVNQADANGAFTTLRAIADKWSDVVMKLTDPEQIKAAKKNAATANSMAGIIKGSANRPYIFIYAQIKHAYDHLDSWQLLDTQIKNWDKFATDQIKQALATATKTSSVKSNLVKKKLVSYGQLPAAPPPTVDGGLPSAPGGAAATSAAPAAAPIAAPAPSGTEDSEYDPKAEIKSANKAIKTALEPAQAAAQELKKEIENKDTTPINLNTLLSSNVNITLDDAFNKNLAELRRIYTQPKTPIKDFSSVDKIFAALDQKDLLPYQQYDPRVVAFAGKWRDTPRAEIESYLSTIAKQVYQIASNTTASIDALNKSGAAGKAALIKVADQIIADYNPDNFQIANYADKEAKVNAAYAATLDFAKSTSYKNLYYASKSDNAKNMNILDSVNKSTKTKTTGGSVNFMDLNILKFIKLAQTSTPGPVQLAIPDNILNKLLSGMKDSNDKILPLISPTSPASALVGEDKVKPSIDALVGLFTAFKNEKARIEKLPINDKIKSDAMEGIDNNWNTLLTQLYNPIKANAKKPFSVFISKIGDGSLGQSVTSIDQFNKYVIDAVQVMNKTIEDTQKKFVDPSIQPKAVPGAVAKPKPKKEKEELQFETTTSLRINFLKKFAQAPQANPILGMLPLVNPAAGKPAAGKPAAGGGVGGGGYVVSKTTPAEKKAIESMQALIIKAGEACDKGVEKTQSGSTIKYDGKKVKNPKDFYNALKSLLTFKDQDGGWGPKTQKALEDINKIIQSLAEEINVISNTKKPSSEDDTLSLIEEIKDILKELIVFTGGKKFLPQAELGQPYGYFNFKGPKNVAVYPMDVDSLRNFFSFIEQNDPNFETAGEVTSKTYLQAKQPKESEESTEE